MNVVDLYTNSIGIFPGKGKMIDLLIPKIDKRENSR